MPRETGRAGYKVKLKKKLEQIFPGCVIQHQDPNIIHQGIPDLLILFNGKWAMLETKAGVKAAYEPNQEYWIEHYNKIGFAASIYPENEAEVLHALQHSLS